MSQIIVERALIEIFGTSQKTQKKNVILTRISLEGAGTFGVLYKRGKAGGREPEGEIVVAHGRLPSPTHCTGIICICTVQIALVGWMSARFLK